MSGIARSGLSQAGTANGNNQVNRVDNGHAVGVRKGTRNASLPMRWHTSRPADIQQRIAELLPWN